LINISIRKILIFFLFMVDLEVHNKTLKFAPLRYAERRYATPLS
jgi:hypothetical protein